MADIRITEDSKEDKENNKTPLKFSKNKKNKNKTRWSRKRKAILLVLALFIAIMGFYGVKIYQTLNKIFSEAGINVPGLLGELTPLKGEKEGRTNILVLGVGDKGHGGENLSDTIMVVSIDTKNKKVAMISVPRDMYVNIPGYGYSRINEAHSLGETNKKGGGPDKAKETIAQTLDIPIHYYARLDFSGLSKLVDAVGGVDIYVEEDIYDPYYPGGTFSINKGNYHMDGEQALKYSRSRKTTSDFDRAKRQQQVIMAVKQKALSSSTVFNPKKVLELMTVVGDHIKTDFQLAEIKRAYELTKNVGNDQIIRKVIDNDKTGLLVSGNIGGASVLQPAAGNLKDIRTFVRDVFSTEATQSKDTNASILVVNSTGVQGEALKQADALRSAGFVDVTTEMGAPKNKTVIYDYTNGAKKSTLEYISGQVKAEVVTQNTVDNADFKIILGADYSGS